MKGQSLRIQRRVVLVLPPVGSQRLLEITRPIVQTHADQRQSQIRGGLEVIAGQNAEATGVDRQHLGDTELHREVADPAGHRRLGISLRGHLLIPQRLGQILVEIGRQVVEPFQECLIFGKLIEPRPAHLAEQCHRVPAGLRPLLGIDALEQVLGGGVPRPAQVRRQLTQRGETVRKGGTNGEPAESFHASDLTDEPGCSQCALHPREVIAATTVRSGG